MCNLCCWFNNDDIVGVIWKWWQCLQVGMVPILRLATAFKSLPNIPCNAFKSLLPTRPRRFIQISICFSKFSKVFLFSLLCDKGVSWGGAEVLIAPRGRILDLWVTKNLHTNIPGDCFSICTKPQNHTRGNLSPIAFFLCFRNGMLSLPSQGVVGLCSGEVKLWI